MVWFWGCSLAGILGSIPAGLWMSVGFKCCVLSGRGLCVRLITRPEVSYRLWCVVVCDREPSIMRRPWPITTFCIKPDQHGTVSNSHPVYDNFLLSEIFRPALGLPTFSFIGYCGVFFYGEGVQRDRCVKRPDLQLAPRIGIRGSVTPVLPYSFMVCIGGNFVLYKHSRNSDSVGVRRSGDRICCGSEIFRTVPGDRPASCTIGTASPCSG